MVKKRQEGLQECEHENLENVDLSKRTWSCLEDNQVWENLDVRDQRKEFEKIITVHWKQHFYRADPEKSGTLRNHFTGVYGWSHQKIWNVQGRK